MLSGTQDVAFYDGGAGTVAYDNTEIYEEEQAK
jgi:hypothetical protein